MRSIERVILSALLLAPASACARERISATCGTPETAIGTIQGTASTSPLAGRAVEVEGVVTASFVGAEALGGFFLQAMAADQPEDGPGSRAGNETSRGVGVSQGLFVVTAEADPARGDRMRVAGTVAERDGMTVLTDVIAVVRCGTAKAAEKIQPAAAEGDLEAVEGMLVRIDGPLTVADTYALGDRGQWRFARGGRPYAPTNGGASPSAPRPSRLAIDDGSWGEPARSLPRHADGRPPRSGDQVASLIGIIVENAGGFALHPTEPFELSVRNPRPTVPPDVGGSLRIAAFNVLNYFTTLGGRGASMKDELDRQERKLVAAIRALDADVVGLIEMENGGRALGRLVAALGGGEAGSAYAVAGEAAGETGRRVGDDDIRVALIYRRDRVQAVGAMQALADPVFRNRPPIAQTFRAGTETFTVIAAHFKSKGGCNNATGPDRDQGDDQGCWNDLRVREARRMLTLIEDLQRSSGDDDVLILGDLNAYGAEDPVVALREGGLVDLTHRFVEPPERYSFVYRGLAGSLDYAFATAGFAERATGAAYWHINADESRVLDYRSENPQALYQPGPFRSSDHDPLIVGFER